MTQQPWPTPLTAPQCLSAPSGVAWSQWEGGNLPAFEDLTSTWSKSQSSFTLVAWVAIAFLVVATAGAFAVAAGVSTSVLGPATFIQSLLAAAPTAGLATMNTVLASAAIEAAAVGAVSGLAGATMTGAVAAPYSGARSGFGVPTVPDSEAGKNIYDGVKGKFDTPAITDMGVSAVSQGLYGTACPPGVLAASCADSGVVPRADLGSQVNNVQFWRDNGKPLPVYDPLVP
jgi:hypothetical protein